ncbi:YppG family protein [Halobacillus sp. BBL2006]|uniref:YppG family protein n=1 Tax=Halobacillus sp. BBL2006 TaxID=1543706 RepID=UPI000543EABA|nr:YppG family protein [Halobacillus sp. BBL2006]KHE71618.1 hypothetical protein LD39_08905 [Halobacillus sp. BBL2006]
MYPYNQQQQQWPQWYRVPSSYPYYQPAPQSYASEWNFNPSQQGMYTYQNPYMYSYDYAGYTENGNANPSMNVGAIPKTFMNYFQDEEGQLDLDKMMSTTGQVMKTVKQVSPIVKGIGSFVKGIK